jgi:hypothetical protein
MKSSFYTEHCALRSRVFLPRRPRFNKHKACAILKSVFAPITSSHFIGRLFHFLIYTLAASRHNATQGERGSALPHHNDLPENFVWISRFRE